MRNSSTTHRVAAIAAAALCFGSLSSAFAQGTTPATPGASSAPAPAPPVTAQPPAAAPAQPNAPASTAPAPTTPAAPAAPKLAFSGLIDFYYLYDFNNPHHLPNNNLGIPLYDVRHNTPTLSLAELNVAQAAPTTGGFGFKGTFIAGDTADINHGGIGNTDPSVNQEARFKNIQQLYATYGFNGGGGIDFGKFYTPFGYEVTESNGNYNYSRSDVFSYLLPFYHAGFRAYTPAFKDGITLTGYIVNSINDTANEGVRDDNNDKGYIGQFNYTDPKGKVVFIENFGYSKDKNAFGFTLDKTTLSDTDFTYTPDPKDTFGLNYVYRKDDGGSLGRLSTNGYAVYYRYQITPKDAAAFRYSYVDQRAFGRPWDLTATYEIKTTAQFLTRAEYRYDKVYSPFAFPSGDTTKNNQSTVSLSEVFTF